MADDRSSAGKNWIGRTWS